MSDEEILSRLQILGDTHSATEIAMELNALIPNGISHSGLIFYMKRAFPEIPLRVLTQAGSWERISDGGMSSLEFDQLFAEWLPRRRDSTL